MLKIKLSSMIYDGTRSELKDKCIVKNNHIEPRKPSQKSPAVLTRIINPLKTHVLKFSHRINKYFPMNISIKSNQKCPPEQPTSESSVSEWKAWYKSTSRDSKLKFYERLIVPQKPFATRIPLSIAMSTLMVGWKKEGLCDPPKTEYIPSHFH
ncbi:hypothetical protein DSO57_1034094 [Entomophthora muscae]|uniref:Uncharacterized protein n=1 Tax=Entomophthora muscae TaxID=34485 RepID=A0ACC2SCL4_9FUNG|nr:hypothetical protein DSO57_1034094 [Entomophthora muscae]